MTIYRAEEVPDCSQIAEFCCFVVAVFKPGIDIGFLNAFSVSIAMMISFIFLLC